MKSLILIILWLFCIDQSVYSYYSPNYPIRVFSDTVPEFKIEKLFMEPMKVLYIADSVNLTEQISGKMGNAYAQIFGFIGQKQLTSEKVMAIYHTLQPPFVFDAAVEVGDFPDELSGRIQSKTIQGGEAVRVHFKGPYSKLEIAYKAISEWIKQNNKQADGHPIEVYLNDPGTVNSMDDLLTDVYQFIK